MNVSIENTSGIPTLVWVVGVVILAAVVLYAIRHGHNVKIGPIEFEGKDKKEEGTPSETVRAVEHPKPAEQKKIDPTADALTEGKAHLLGTTRELDYDLAYLYLQKAADSGSIEALFYLGYMYEYGLSVRLDYQMAMSFFRKAADQGSAEAMNNIGFLYEFGHGVPADSRTAAEWYIKSADLGCSAGQGNAARMYKNGKGVEKDLEKALQLNLQAVSQGNESAMNNLGVMYEDGEGVPQDYAQAIHWYQEAAKNGNKSAPRAIERLKKSNPELFS